MRREKFVGIDLPFLPLTSPLKKTNEHYLLKRPVKLFLTFHLFTLFISVVITKKIIQSVGKNAKMFFKFHYKDNTVLNVQSWHHSYTYLVHCFYLLSMTPSLMFSIIIDDLYKDKISDLYGKQSTLVTSLYTLNDFINI